MTIKELIDLANKYIDDGASVHLNETIDHSLVLRVFNGSQWTGGVWERWRKRATVRFSQELRAENISAIDGS